MSYPSKPKGPDPNGMQPMSTEVPGVPDVPSTSALGGAPKLKPAALAKPVAKTNDYRPPWQLNSFQPESDARVQVTTKPRYPLRDVTKGQPELVKAWKDKLWSMMEGMSEAERQTPFWKQVAANPEGAAAALVARVMENAAPEQQEAATLSSEAMSRMSGSELYRYLAYRKGVK